MDERSRLPHDAVVGAWLETSVPIEFVSAPPRAKRNKLDRRLSRVGQATLRQLARAIGRVVITCVAGITALAVFVGLGLGAARLTGHILGPPPGKVKGVPGPKAAAGTASSDSAKPADGGPAALPTP